MTDHVVIGIGDLYRRDDAAGLAVAHLVSLRAPDHVGTVSMSGDPADLLLAWSGTVCVFVVDAVRGEATPGLVYRAEIDLATGSEPRRGTSMSSSHSLDLVHAVELGRLLDRLPRRMILYGIEGATFGYGIGLSPGVRRGVHRIAERILGEMGGSVSWPPSADPEPLQPLA